MDHVNPAYRDKLVTENYPPVFHPNPSVKETEKPISVTPSGRHASIQIPWVSSATSHGLPRSKTFDLNRTITFPPIHSQKFVSPSHTSRLG
ncbi:hypothetical protein ACTXT7_014429 [Hymenolepis weldensis]